MSVDPRPSGTQQENLDHHVRPTTLGHADSLIDHSLVAILYSSRTVSLVSGT